jgi:hypothetical protein
MMMNQVTKFKSPLLPLSFTDSFGRMIEDPNRQYSKKLTHLYSWEIVELAELCKAEIELPRKTSWRKDVRFPDSEKMGRPPKYDYVNRFLFVLEFLSSGESVHRAEFEKMYAKSSIDEDRKHVLKAINKVLADEIRWPNALERAALRTNYTGIFSGTVGVLDVTEHNYFRSKNSVIEYETN